MLLFRCPITLHFYRQSRTEAYVDQGRYYITSPSLCGQWKIVWICLMGSTFLWSYLMSNLLRNLNISIMIVWELFLNVLLLLCFFHFYFIFIHYTVFFHILISRSYPHEYTFVAYALNKTSLTGPLCPTNLNGRICGLKLHT